MARVPTYTTRRELPSGPNGLPSVRMSAAPTAGDLNAQRDVPNAEANRDLSNATQSLSAAVSAIELRRDQAQVMVVESEVKKAFALKQQEWKQRTGVNAFGVTGEATKWMDEQLAAYDGKLANERQRTAFSKIYSNLRLQSEVAVSEHEAVENRKATVEAAKSSIEMSAELASQNPRSREALIGAREDVIQRTALIARTTGLDKASHAALELTHLSRLHDGVVSALVGQKDTKAARAYYDEAVKEGELNESTKARLAKVFEVADKAEKAQAFADSAINEGLSESDALKRAESELSGEDEKEAKAEIIARFAQQRAAQQREQAVADEQGWDQFNRSGRFSDIDPAVVARMDPKTVAAIKDKQLNRAKEQESLAYTRQQRKNAEADRDYTLGERERVARERVLNRTGGQLAADILDRAGMDPTWFAGIDLRKDESSFTPQQYAQLTAHQRQVRAELQKAGGAIDPTKLDVVTAAQQVADVGARLKLDKAERANFELAANDALNREQLSKGRKLTQAERQAVLDRMVVETVTDVGWIRDSKALAYQVKPEQAAKVARQQGVPDTEIQKIIPALQRRNIPVTAESILKLYQAKPQKQNPLIEEIPR